MGEQERLVLEEEWHQRFLEALKIDRISRTKLYQRVKPLLTEDDIKKILTFYDYDKITNYLRSKLGKDLNIKSVNVLRNMARRRGIKDYNRLDKETLIGKLTNNEKPT